MKTLTIKTRVHEVTPKGEISTSAIVTIALRASVRNELVVMQM